MDSSGRWSDGSNIAGAGGEAGGKLFLLMVLDLIFSKCLDVNATCHYETCGIFHHETTNKPDSHLIHHQLVEQIYPSFLNLGLSEWDSTCG